MYLQNEMQNERKNNTELIKLLDQQQQLTLTNNKRLELLETEIEEKNSKKRQDGLNDSSVNKTDEL